MIETCAIDEIAVKKALVSAGAVGAIKQSKDFGDLDEFGVGAVLCVLIDDMLKNRNMDIDTETKTAILEDVLTHIQFEDRFDKYLKATKYIRRIPGLGKMLSMGTGAIANVFFTYRFAGVFSAVLDKMKLENAKWDALKSNTLEYFEQDFSFLDVYDMSGYLFDVMMKCCVDTVEVAKEKITDGAKYVGDTIALGFETTVDGAKRLGKWLKDKWNG